jgi:methylphosphotriester-DNA--protein-cysteine methyltransferase
MLQFRNSSLLSLKGVAVSEMLATRTRNAMIVECLLKYLEAHPCDILSKTTLCEALGLNENSFRRACKQQFGIGPTRYAKKHRMQLAQPALLTADQLLHKSITHLGRFLRFRSGTAAHWRTGLRSGRGRFSRYL